MKKTFIAAAALLLVFSCGQGKSTQELQKEFNDAVAQIFDQYKAEEISEDEADSTLRALCVATIKKNPNDSVALAALQNCYYIMEDDELVATMDNLGKQFQDNEFVQKVRKSIDARKGTSEGAMFTDFTVVQDENDPENSTVKFSDFVGQGKYVLVDFWASWCGPCKREIPNIAAVYDKYKGDNFDVLSVAVWDKPEDTAKAAEEHGVIWNQITNAQRIPTDIYGIDGIPHIMLVGPDGTIIKRNLRGEAIEAAVKEALGL
jgi:thiol-disulfide isomerase/thioredoxin